MPRIGEDGAGRLLEPRLAGSIGLLNADAKPATPVAIDYESYRELRFEMNHLF